MKIITNLLSIFMVLFFISSLKAEEPGIDVSEGDEAQFAASPGDKAREWLEERCEAGKRCLVEGYNNPEKDGQSTVFVAIGIGYSSMSNTSQQIHNARQNAFSKAMLNAKDLSNPLKPPWISNV